MTLDLDRESQALRDVCREVLDRWVEVIAQGLDDVPQDERRSVALLILATLDRFVSRAAYAQLARERGLFMIPGGPTASPQRFGTTAQSSCRFGRMAGRFNGS